MDNFATTLGTKEQLAIKEYADALLVIPRTLAVNAAQDATDLVAKLCALQHKAQNSVRLLLLSSSSFSSMAVGVIILWTRQALGCLVRPLR